MSKQTISEIFRIIFNSELLIFLNKCHFEFNFKVENELKLLAFSQISGYTSQIVYCKNTTGWSLII